MIAFVITISVAPFDISSVSIAGFACKQKSTSGKVRVLKTKFETAIFCVLPKAKLSSQTFITRPFSRCIHATTSLCHPATWICFENANIKQM